VHAADVTATAAVAEDGPYPVLLAAPFAQSDPYHLAVAGSYDAASGAGGYAAVPGTGKALVGSLSADGLNGPAAVLKGLQRGLGSYDDGARVRLILGDATLIGLFARRSFLADSYAGRYSADRYLKTFPWPDTFEAVCGHLRRLTVDLQQLDPGALRRAKGKVPNDRLLGPAFRLAWAMSNLSRDGVEVGQQALRWMSTFATSKNSVEKLRVSYNRMLSHRTGALRDPSMSSGVRR
jgi:hypothetical protein